MSKITAQQYYRARIRALEDQVKGLESEDVHEQTIEYLIGSAETFLGAAKVLIDMRTKTKEPAP